MKKIDLEIKKISNPLFEQKELDSITVDASGIKTPTSFKSVSKKRQILKLFRQESAEEAIKGLTKKVGIFGFTRGQFSLIELIEAVLNITGPAHLTVSTWTASNADLKDVFSFIKSGRVLSARFLIDFSFQRRQPEVAKAIRDTFGLGSLRITRNHAKFFQLTNVKGWNLTCKTSMNLNKNPRFEDFDISNDRELFKFLSNIIDELFKKHKSAKQAKMDSTELWNEWQGK